MAALLIGSLSPAFADSGNRAAEWPLDAAHFQSYKVWQINRGSGVTVAVVDSGVDAAHPDLVGQVLPGISLLGDGGDGRSDISGDSHGTAIAALIAGTGVSAHGQGIIGLAPAAKILPVRVATGGQVTAPVLAQGIIWAADHGARVINVSMGSPDPDPLLKQAIAYALRKDAVVVASAGNDGASGNEVMYPAGFPGVISVSGTDQNHQFWTTSESGPDITLAAPAAGIASANDQGHYVQADGTSYAAGYVSASAALIRSRYPSLTSGQVIRRLIATTRNHHDTPDTQLGYGEVDPLSALTATVDTTSIANPLLAPTPSGASGTPSSGVGTALVAALTVGGTLALVLLGALLLRRRRTTAQTARMTATAYRTRSSSKKPPARSSSTRTR